MRYPIDVSYFLSLTSIVKNFDVISDKSFTDRRMPKIFEFFLKDLKVIFSKLYVSFIELVIRPKIYFNYLVQVNSMKVNFCTLPLIFLFFLKKIRKNLTFLILC